MHSRREELIVSALTGDPLSDAEQQELDNARAADPSIDDELEELQATAARLRMAVLTWRDEAPPAGLEERILRATSEAEEEDRQESGTPARSSCS